MQLTIMRRLAAGTAVAATAASLAVVPALTTGSAGAQTAAATTRIDTTMSIRAVKPSVAPGRSGTIKGRLAVPGGDPTGRTVLLEARSQGAQGFVPIGTAVTGAYGIAKLRVTPATTTHYRWRYAGSADTDRAKSGITRVRVRVNGFTPTRVRTSLSIRLKNGVADSRIVRGSLFSPGGDVGRRWVVLSSRTGAGEWAFESSARTDARGRVIFGVRPQAQTAYRLAFLGTPKLRPSRSARVVVRMPSEVSISAVPGIVDPGVASTVSGAVYASGAPVAGASVNLVSRPVKGNGKWSTEQTATTAADGTIAFSVAPQRSTAYQLRVVPTTGVPAGKSAVARVDVRAGSSLSIRGRTAAPGYIVEGQLRAAGVKRAGRTISLQAVAPGSTEWAPVGVDNTNKHGRVKFTLPSVAGTQYRLVYDGEAHFLPATSGTVVN